ncbi:MAG: ATP-dependent RecD-like DNA helicase [Deltaproteobacteria bacterium]|nr:ATP-dependent RecD-like DNA helicase [Deltaproteobacteria bacterium]
MNSDKSKSKNKTQSKSETAIEGVIEHIIFHNVNNGYTIAKLKPGPGKRPVTIVGSLADAAAGQAVKARGRWVTHARYGQQFAFNFAETILPSDRDGIRRFLTSGVIKGIGVATADRIIEHFGEDTIKILETAPERLVEVNGIGKQKAATMTEGWRSHAAVNRIMIFLQDNGINGAWAARIFSLYGADAEQILRTDPYRLSTDMGMAGFPVADAIARQNGIDENDIPRISACIRYVMAVAGSEGHVFLPKDDLTEEVCRRFETGREIVSRALDILMSDHIVTEDMICGNIRAVYPERLYRAETGIAARLSAMALIPVSVPCQDVEILLDGLQEKQVIRLSNEQEQALSSVFTHRTAVITGGPGTGKTTLIRLIARAFHTMGMKVCLAAPTGRAARRISEVTSMPAHTIHKLLGYSFDDKHFEKVAENPIEADVIIIDEASMIDTDLMFHLLSATPVTSRLILVGDAAQLPPVGPGNVLSDIISSGLIPISSLKEVFRQTETSEIITSAHKILSGLPPDIVPFDPKGNSDFGFVFADSPEQTARIIVDLCKRILPEEFSFDPAHDIQVLSPMHKGYAGTIDLNMRLQKAINPGRVLLKGIYHSFKTNDRVMHIKNNYEKEVFNGDIGTVAEIDTTARAMVVSYDGRKVEYEEDEIDELALGYAISVHKSQGSEYPAVIMPVITRHYIMLQRNLLYTAVTRARRLVILVGSKKALGIALENDKPQRRFTALAERLKQGG